MKGNEQTYADHSASGHNVDSFQRGRVWSFRRAICPPKRRTGEIAKQRITTGTADDRHPTFTAGTLRQIQEARQHADVNNTLLDGPEWASRPGPETSPAPGPREGRLSRVDFARHGGNQQGAHGSGTPHCNPAHAQHEKHIKDRQIQLDASHRPVGPQSYQPIATTTASGPKRMQIRPTMPAP